jgi:hypothetical protein
MKRRKPDLNLQIHLSTEKKLEKHIRLEEEWMSRNKHYEGSA